MRFLIIFFVFSLLSFQVFAAEKESAYDRVMASGKIRCGYGVNPPWIYRDLQTGEISGVIVDIMEAVAKKVSLELEWPEETGWGNLPASLQSGRVDVSCSTLWNDPARGRQVAFTDPVFYQALYPYAVSEKAIQFDSIEKINSADVKISVQEGDFGFFLAQRLFPKAQIVSISQGTPWSDTALNVITGKADIMFSDDVMISDFNKNNEKKLQKTSLSKPVAVYGNALAVGIGQSELKEVMQTAVRFLVQTGEIEQITREFREKYPGVMLLPQKPYQETP